MVHQCSKKSEEGGSMSGQRFQALNCRWMPRANCNRQLKKTVCVLTNFPIFTYQQRTSDIFRHPGTIKFVFVADFGFVD